MRRVSRDNSRSLFPLTLSFFLALIVAGGDSSKEKDSKETGETATGK